MNDGMIQRGALCQVLAEVIVGRRTGDVQCTRLSEARHLFFRDGELVFASTSVESERIGQILMREGLVESVMLEAVLGTVAPGRRTGRILVAEGVLTPERLVKAVDQFVRQVVSGAFAWKDGRVRFTDGENSEIEDVLVEMPTADVILDAARTIPMASIALQAIGNVHEPLRFSIDPALRFQKLRFNEEEAAVLNCINNLTTAEEICEASPLDKDATLKIICGLITGGILERPGPATTLARAEVDVGVEEPGTFEFPDDLFGEPLVLEEPAPRRPAAPLRRLRIGRADGRPRERLPGAAGVLESSGSGDRGDHDCCHL